MSDDLISRKATIEVVKMVIQAGLPEEAIYAKIEEIPTSFDKEKVIMELEEIGQECNECNDIFGAEAIEYAAEIVEKGGIE